MRALVFAFFALLGCSRESASPSPSPSPGTEGGAPAGPQTGAVAPMEACVSASISLETLLVSLPRACNSASDCDGYYLRPGPCQPPVVLAKPGCPPERKAALEGLQAEMRRVCPPDTGACAPRPFRAECRARRCVDGLTPATMR